MKIKTKNGKWTFTGDRMTRTIEAKILLNYHNHPGDNTVQELIAVLQTLPPTASVSIFSNDEDSEDCDYIVADLYETRPPTPDELLSIERRKRVELKKQKAREQELKQSATVLDALQRRTAAMMLPKLLAELQPVMAALSSVETALHDVDPQDKTLLQDRGLLIVRRDQLLTKISKYERICNDETKK